MKNKQTDEISAARHAPQSPQCPGIAEPPASGRRRTLARKVIPALALVLPAIAIAALLYELRTSRLQAIYLTRLAADCSYRLEPGPSRTIRFPDSGPYDERSGYAVLPDFVWRLSGSGYTVAAQARLSPALLDLADLGLSAVYREKPQVGLRIVDRRNQVIFAEFYPARVYADFDAVPDIAVRTLLFIENRELLDPRFPYRNPAVEWDRLARAFLDMGLRWIDPDHHVPGGSTLATQIEKFRHSPRGQTGSMQEKFKQMVSASLRAYLNGEQTMASRRRVVLEFINSMPLGAIPGQGEVTGLGDGLSDWYGMEFSAWTSTLAARPTGADDPRLAAWSRSLKQMVSLFVAQRRPSYFLSEDRQALENKTNSYLRVLAEAGIITDWERDAALQQKLALLLRAAPLENTSFVERKAVNAVRTDLLSLLGLQQLYQLNHLDLEVKSTIDQQLQQEVTAYLRQLQDPDRARAEGLRGSHLLEQGNPAKVIYSFTLYEHAGGVNLLRVQADNFNQPLSINAGIKLELGSSAKLRTLISYLQIVAALHERYVSIERPQLLAVQVPASDHLSRWAVDYLAGAADRGLVPMLTAALQRRYSASPNERFYTGGGEHSFANFDPDHDRGVFTVQEAFRNSINLVFIRMMRDIVNYYKFQLPGVTELMADAEDPRRQEYLARFADREGSLFLQRFLLKYQDRNFEEAFALLLQNLHATPARLAAVFRYVQPDADQDRFAAFMQVHFANPVLSQKTLRKLYGNYAPPAFSLIDRGYIARIHPLELWLVAYLRQHPAAGREEIMQASAAERQAVYRWLFKTSHKNRQDLRIRSLLEMEAFHAIHAEWKRLKYPFDSLVPSYATAIGSSADRPVALATLMGIIINNGKWYPAIRVEELHFAGATPYETLLQYQAPAGEQVLRPEIAGVVREALLDVVDNGTAKRVSGAFSRPDGTAVAIGGKTGTGDNRREVYGAGGRLLQSTAINRTAVFVFFLDNRFFGAITAYVAGQDAAGYSFTSALPVQVLKGLAPRLMPMLAPAESAAPPAAEASSPPES